MTSASAFPDRSLLQRRADPAPLRPAWRALREGYGSPEILPLGSDLSPALVLRALVERFGGEVTGSALTRYLSQRLGWTPLAIGPRMTEALQDLHRRAAVSLESMDGADVIVRLLPDGAEPYL